MQPHHEAAEMTHATVPESVLPINPPQYNDEKKEPLTAITVHEVSSPTSEKSVYAITSSTSIDDEESSAASSQITLAPFDRFYKYFMTAAALSGLVLFFKLILSSPGSEEWITANLYLAIRAFVLVNFHMIAGIRRYVIGRTKGVAPWQVDAMSVICNMACCALHYSYASQGGDKVDLLIPDA